MKVTFLEEGNARTQAFLTALANLPNDLPDGGKGGWRMIAKTIVLFLWAMLSYVFALKSYSLYGSWIITGAAFIHFGIALAFMTINVGHDAYSETPWVNKLCGMMMNLTGGNIFSWRTQHTFHHEHTNIEGKDPDIYYGWFLRILSSEKWRPIHKHQHVYVWLLYLGAGIQIIWMSDLLLFITGKIRKVPVSIPAKEYLIYILWKVIHVFLFYVIPAIVLGNFLYAFYLYLCMVTAAGYLMAILFQWAHIIDITQFVIVLEPGMENDRAHLEQIAREANTHEVVVIVKPDEAEVKIQNAWIIHELVTTADISPDNWVGRFFFGGLTLQVEHHLFPHVCHLHYRELQKRLTVLCTEYDIPYNSCPSFIEGLVRHGRKIWMMGQQPIALVS